MKKLLTFLLLCSTPAITAQEEWTVNIYTLANNRGICQQPDVYVSTEIIHNPTNDYVHIDPFDVYINNQSIKKECHNAIFDVMKTNKVIIEHIDSVVFAHLPKEQASAAEYYFCYGGTADWCQCTEARVPKPELCTWSTIKKSLCLGKSVNLNASINTTEQYHRIKTMIGLVHTILTKTESDHDIHKAVGKPYNF